MTVFLAREFPLDPDPEYEVKYAREVVDEIADLEEPEALMDELEEELAVEPYRPRGGRGKKLQDAEGLYRYRPHYDNDLRIFYGIEGEEVWILGLHPRKQAYRRQNIETAVARLRRTVDRTD